jgi:hypothetical protein
MGMDQTVSFAQASRPAWGVVRDLLVARGLSVQVCMIDGQLAFPDELPPEGWRELRLGTPAGMVTVRRESGRLVCVIWGNADDSLVRAWNAVTWAFAQASGGLVQLPSRPSLSAREFADSGDFPAGFST